MLLEMSIAGYKPFGPRQSFRLAPLTLVYGPNSGGKSSLIEAIKVLLSRETSDALVPGMEQSGHVDDLFHRTTETTEDSIKQPIEIAGKVIRSYDPPMEQVLARSISRKVEVEGAHEITYQGELSQGKVEQGFNAIWEHDGESQGILRLKNVEMLLLNWCHAAQQYRGNPEIKPIHITTGHLLLQSLRYDREEKRYSLEIPVDTTEANKNKVIALWHMAVKSCLPKFDFSGADRDSMWHSYSPRNFYEVLINGALVWDFISDHAQFIATGHGEGLGKRTWPQFAETLITRLPINAVFMDVSGRFDPKEIKGYRIAEHRLRGERSMLMHGAHDRFATATSNKKSEVAATSYRALTDNQNESTRLAAKLFLLVSAEQYSFVRNVHLSHIPALRPEPKAWWPLNEFPYKKLLQEGEFDTGPSRQPQGPPRHRRLSPSLSHFISHSVNQSLKMLNLNLEIEVVNKALAPLGRGVSVEFKTDTVHPNLVHVGTGVSQVLGMLVELHGTSINAQLTRRISRSGFEQSGEDLPPVIHLIQQPELHLHPKQQADLADVLIDITGVSEEDGKPIPYVDYKKLLSDKNEKDLYEYVTDYLKPVEVEEDAARALQNPWQSDHSNSAKRELPFRLDKTQIVAETHSEMLIYRIMRRIRENNLRPEDVCVLYVNPHPDGYSTVQELRLNDEGDFIDDWPQGFFDEDAAELFGFSDQESE